MFFDSVTDIKAIAARAGTSVFVIPRDLPLEIPGAILLQPEEKTVITVEQVRTVCAKVCTRQVTDTFVLIRPADKLPAVSANAFLKTLEQPGDKVHFVLVTDAPERLLPTIMSRAAIYFLRPRADFLEQIAGSDRHKDLARQLLTAKGAALVSLAQDISKAKAGEVQQQALTVLQLAIEMAYKSYLKTPKTAFLAKLPRLIAAYENIARGGNIKLQIVANLC